MAAPESNKPANLSWFTQSTLRFTPLLLELAMIAIVVRLIGLVEPFVFQTLIDRVLPFQREASLNLILAVLVGSTFFSAALSSLSSLLANQIANRLTFELGGRVFSHALSLPTLFLQRFQVGELLARIGEVDSVRNFLTSTVTELMIDLLFVVVYVFALYSLSPQLTLIVLIMLPLQMMSFAVFGPFIRRRMQASFAAEAAQQSRQVEAFGSPIAIKSISAEKLHTDRVTQALGGSLAANWHVTKVIVSSEAFGQVLRGMSVVLVIYFGSAQVFQGTLTFGQLVAFHLLSQNVAGPIFSVSKIWEKWQEFRIARLRLGDLLNESAEGDAQLPVLLPASNAPLEARNVSFSYVEDRPVLKALSMLFPPQQTSVITGDSGCGKSTIAKVLCGLYKPSAGDVLFAGQNITLHDPASVRSRIAYVSQEPILFNGTILENLLMAAPDASTDEIESALQQSEALGFVKTFPKALDTEVGDQGGRLSGGQRQRIAIARSLLTNPDVLVLDEPTSSLDEETSRKVMDTLADLSAFKTIIIITHRPDLVKGKVTVFDLNKALNSAHD
jgi:ATP-binding cassette, subfamily B, bacterial HlyB/CyaB